MQYLGAIRKSDGQLVRVLRVENEDWQHGVWYIVPAENEVIALTPGDFDMGYKVVINVLQSDND